MLSVLLKAHAARTNPILTDIIGFWRVCSIDYATCKSPRDFQHDSMITLQQTVHLCTCSLIIQMMAILHWQSLYKGGHMVHITRTDIITILPTHCHWAHSVWGHNTCHTTQCHKYTGYNIILTQWHNKQDKMLCIQWMGNRYYQEMQMSSCTLLLILWTPQYC